MIMKLPSCMSRITPISRTEVGEGWHTVHGKSSKSPIRVSPNTDVSPHNSFSSLDHNMGDDRHQTDDEDIVMDNYPADPLHGNVNLPRDKPKRKIE